MTFSWLLFSLLMQPVGEPVYIASTEDGFVTFTDATVSPSDDGFPGLDFMTVGRAPSDGPNGEPQFFTISGRVDFDCDAETVRNSSFQMRTLDGTVLSDLPERRPFRAYAGSGPLEALGTVVCETGVSGMPTIPSAQILIQTFVEMTNARWREQRGETQ